MRRVVLMLSGLVLKMENIKIIYGNRRCPITVAEIIFESQVLQH